MRSGRKGRRKWIPDEQVSHSSTPDPEGTRAPLTADNAPTGSVPVQPPPPPRGARPYRSTPPREALRTPPPRRSSGGPGTTPRHGSRHRYERYDTDGYAPGQPPEASTPNRPRPVTASKPLTNDVCRKSSPSPGSRRSAAAR